MPNQNLIGEQTLIAEVGRNFTQDILGIPFNGTDLNTINIDIAKLNNKIKVLDYNDLVKEEIKRINSFRLNLQMDFVETVIKIHYVGILDIISELGGLNASVNSIFA